MDYITEYLTKQHSIGVALTEAVRKNDSKAIDQILSYYSEFLRNPENIHLVKSLIVTKNYICFNDEIINRLLSFLKEGANQNELVVAIVDGNLELLKNLLKSGVKVSSWKGCNSLACYALLRTNISTRKETLKLLIRYGLDVTYRNQRNENLLHLFMNDDYKEGDPDALEIVEILTDSGTPVNGLDDFLGVSPLHYVVTTQNIKLVKVLLNKGADVNIKSKKGQIFPLYAAVETNNVPMVDFLLSNGAEINAKDESGITVLYLPCFYNYLPMISLLIQRGADVTVKTLQGDTPFSVLNPALEYYDECIITMVKQFAKLVFEKHSISDRDMSLIQKNVTILKHFEKCQTELKAMANTKFYGSYSYYSMLKPSKNFKKLAPLTKNRELVSKFRTYSATLCYYKCEVESVFKEIIKIKDHLEEVYSRLNKIFVHFLPNTVKRKLAEILTVEDLPV